MRAEAAGDPGPWRQQTILGRGRWEADALRDVVREHALETLADPDAALVIDETGFLKQGRAFCGMGRQHTGSAGKIANCQIGVFATYVSRHGHAFVDRALYLPKAWTDNPARLAAAHVPADAGFAAKPRLARRMIGQTIAAGAPFSWVAADSIYGVSEIEMALRRASRGYVLGVDANSQFSSWGAKPEAAGTAEEIAQALDPAAWQRLSAGDGAKGARLYDWACLELAKLGADEFNPTLPGIWTRGLLVRRTIADGAHALFAAWRRRARAATRWSRPRASAGPSRTVSKPPKPSSASITTRAGPGTAGAAMSRWSCWRSPCWQPFAATRTARPFRKRHAARLTHAKPPPNAHI